MLGFVWGGLKVLNLSCPGPSALCEKLDAQSLERKRESEIEHAI